MRILYYSEGYGLHYFEVFPKLFSSGAEPSCQLSFKWSYYSHLNRPRASTTLPGNPEENTDYKSHSHYYASLQF